MPEERQAPGGNTPNKDVIIGEFKSIPMKSRKSSQVSVMSQSSENTAPVADKKSTLSTYMDAQRAYDRRASQFTAVNERSLSIVSMAPQPRMMVSNSNAPSLTDSPTQTARTTETDYSIPMSELKSFSTSKQFALLAEKQGRRQDRVMKQVQSLIQAEEEERNNPGRKRVQDEHMIDAISEGDTEEGAIDEDEQHAGIMQKVMNSRDMRDVIGEDYDSEGEEFQSRDENLNKLLASTGSGLRFDGVAAYMREKLGDAMEKRARNRLKQLDGIRSRVSSVLKTFEGAQRHDSPIKEEEMYAEREKFQETFAEVVENVDRTTNAIQKVHESTFHMHDFFSTVMGDKELTEEIGDILAAEDMAKNVQEYSANTRHLRQRVEELLQRQKESNPEYVRSRTMLQRARRRSSVDSLIGRGNHFSSSTGNLSALPVLPVTNAATQGSGPEKAALPTSVVPNQLARRSSTSNISEKNGPQPYFAPTFAPKQPTNARARAASVLSIQLMNSSMDMQDRVVRQLKAKNHTLRNDIDILSRTLEDALSSEKKMKEKLNHLEKLMSRVPRGLALIITNDALMKKPDGYENHIDKINKKIEKLFVKKREEDGNDLFDSDAQVPVEKTKSVSTQTAMISEDNNWDYGTASTFIAISDRRKFSLEHRLKQIVDRKAVNLKRMRTEDKPVKIEECLQELVYEKINEAKETLYKHNTRALVDYFDAEYRPTEPIDEKDKPKENIKIRSTLAEKIRYRATAKKFFGLVHDDKNKQKKSVSLDGIVPVSTVPQDSELSLMSSKFGVSRISRLESRYLMPMSSALSRTSTMLSLGDHESIQPNHGGKGDADSLSAGESDEVEPLTDQMYIDWGMDESNSSAGLEAAPIFPKTKRASIHRAPRDAAAPPPPELLKRRLSSVVAGAHKDFSVPKGGGGVRVLSENMRRLSQDSRLPPLEEKGKKLKKGLKKRGTQEKTLPPSERQDTKDSSSSFTSNKSPDRAHRSPSPKYDATMERKRIAPDSTRRVSWQPTRSSAQIPKKSKRKNIQTMVM